MKVVQPVVVDNHCECSISTYVFYVDEFGVKDMECPEHGPLLTIISLEFNSWTEWKEWNERRKAEAMAERGTTCP